MRILVTGAGGYIAEALIPRLQGAGHYVIPLCRWHREPHVRRYSMLRYHPGNTEQVWFADLAKGFGKLVDEKPPDTMIHLAGRVEINLQPNPKGAHLPPVPGPCDIGALYRDNVLATANVLQYCLQAGVKHLIFASTQAVYGMYSFNAGGFLVSQPLEHYAASKLAAEQLLDIGRTQGLRIDTLRLPGVFGGDRRNGVVYQMCRDALQKGVVTVTAPYPLPIQVMHIEDVVNAFRAILSWTPEPIAKHGLAFDVTGGEPCSLTILAEEIASLVPGCEVVPPDIPQPAVPRPYTWTTHRLAWDSKPRKERLAQVLEEIRREIR